MKYVKYFNGIMFQKEQKIEAVGHAIEDIY